MNKTDLKILQKGNMFMNNKVIINYYTFDGIFTDVYQEKLSEVIEDIKKHKKFYKFIITEDSSFWYINSMLGSNELILPKNGKFNLYFKMSDSIHDDFLSISLKKLRTIPGFILFGLK
jgi:hypothetical protein